MLYEAYEKKIIKIANVRDAIVRRKFLIIGIFAVLTLLLAAFLFVRGIITEDVSCPDSLTYGENIECSASALFGDIDYEFSADGENWSSERPTMPGEYYVRAASRRAFGVRNYGAPRAFVILPRAAQLTIAPDAYYGDLPQAAAVGLIGGDALAAAEVTLDDPRAAIATAAITAGSVRIENAAGADVTAAYALEYAPRTVSVLKRRLTITTGSAAKVYDGAPLTAADWSVTSGSFAFGDTPEVAVTGSLTDAGTAKNTAVVRVFAEGEDMTAKYAITVDAGILEVAQRQITLTSDSAAKVYDGAPLSCGGFALTAGAYAAGESASVVSLTERTDAGESANELTYAVTAADGRDVTHNYAIAATAGTLTVDKRPITLASDSSAKVYDGKPLSHASYAVTAGSFAAGETASVGDRAEQTDVGVRDNELTYEILTAGGRAVTDNYELTAECGTLTVTPRSLTLKSADAQKEYDDSPLFGLSFSIADGSFADGQKAKVIRRAELVDVGECANEHEYSILDVSGSDVTGNYELSRLSGTLTVYQRALTVTADSAEKFYDGTPLTCASVTGDRLVNGHTASALTTGSQTEVGTSYNKIAGGVTVNASDGRDVTANYSIISYSDGTLTVNSRQITVTAGDAAKTYDGAPLTCPDFMADNLVEGHTATAVTAGSQTDVGTAQNAVVAGSVKVFDANGRDITHNYTVTEYYYGTLTVTPRPITIKSGSASKEYDGTELYCTEFTPTEGSLVGKHEIEVTDYATALDVGVVPNVHKYVILDPDANDRDVTFNYLITPFNGELEITPRPISVRTGSAEKVYDGERLYCLEYEITDGSLVDRHYIWVNREKSTSIVDAVQTDNVLNLVISDPVRVVEVTQNYDITFIYGVLRITPRPLVVTADSATKQYDGKPLRCGTVNADNLVAGHSITAKTKGSQAEIGASPNEVVAGSVKIVADANGKITTKNYDISYANGTLTVVEQLMSGDSGGGSGDSGGSGDGGGSGEAAGIDRTGDLSSQFGAGGGKETTFLYVLAQEDGPLYLRDLSFGNYTYYGWTQATPYGKGEPLYYVRDTLAQKGERDRTLTIQSVIDGLPQFTPYYAADNGGAATDVHIGAESLPANASYYAQYIPYDYTQGFNYRYSAAEYAYRDFVRRNYLTVPVSTREVMLRLANRHLTLDGNTLRLIAAVRDYIMSAATYDMEFVIPDDADDMIVYFLTEGKRGVCQHFASAAALMYRALGLPARYVTGFATYGSAGNWVAVTGNSAHAWVEVYVDGMGWVQVEVTPGGAADETGGGSTGGGGGSGGGSGEGGGEVDIDEIIHDEYGNIIVRPLDSEVVYNGSEQSPPKKLYYDSEILFGKGTHCTFEVVGSRTEIGVEKVYVEGLRIFNAQDVDITADFKVVFEPGNFSVMPVPITVSPYPVTKEYDGTPLVCDPSYYYVSDGELLSGHRLEAVASGTRTEAGKGASTVSDARVYDAAGNDVTQYYAVTCVSAPLTVEKRAITIITATSEKVYDGNSFSKTEYRVASGSLADGDHIYANMPVVMTDVGSIENSVEDINIYNSSWQNVTANYDITLVFGTLTVHKRPLSIKTHGATKPYDGTPLTANGYDITGGSLADGHKLLVETKSSQTEKGTRPNLAEARVVDAQGNDVTANYDLLIFNGILEVT